MSAVNLPFKNHCGGGLQMGAYPFRKTGAHPRIKSEGKLFRDMRYRVIASAANSAPTASTTDSTT